MLVILLTIVVATMMVMGPPTPKEVIISWDDFTFEEIEQTTIVADRNTEVIINSTGSVDHHRHGIGANAWIIDAVDRTPVWDLRLASRKNDNPPLLQVEDDTIAVDAGRYEVYFAAYGGRELTEHRPKDWHFELRTLEDDRSVRESHFEVSPSPSNNVLWEEAKIQDDETSNFFFEVERPTNVYLYAVGELDERQISSETDNWFGEKEDDPHYLSDIPLDHYWIEEMIEMEVVWSFLDAETHPAGGAEFNRGFTGELFLGPGLYQAIAQTNHHHSYERWKFIPPWDPNTWGFKIVATERGTMKPFDLWESREPIISFMRVGDDQEKERFFELTIPATLIVYAMGEITRWSDGQRWDYGQLLRVLSDGNTQEIWSLTKENSAHAGGANKNRHAMAFLMLEPGIYLMVYESDGSHAWDSWNEEEPDHPERWGMALFPAAPLLPPGAIVLEMPDPFGPSD